VSKSPYTNNGVPSRAHCPRARYSAITLIIALVTMMLPLAGCHWAPDISSPAFPALSNAHNSDPYLYVSTQGEDHNPGTRSKPLRTISQAAALVRPGMTVVVAPGRYLESVNSSRSGNRNARIIFTSETLWGAQIVGEGAEAAWRNEGDYVDIMNFNMSGNDEVGVLNLGSYVRISRNRIHDFAQGDCITTFNSGYTLHNIDIIGNVAANCGSNMLDHGIYAAYSRGQIMNNVTFGNAGFGIHCWHNCGELIISNNLIFKNGGGLLVGQGDSPNFGSVPADNMLVSNNIVVDNRTTGITEEGATGLRNQYRNNLLYDNADDRISLNTGKESGTVIADPKFIDYRPDGSGDYRLRDLSPGIDAGTNVGASPYAIDGSPRPRGHGYDIGPYER
jgi:pectate disaccharide-lyase